MKGVYRAGLKPASRGPMWVRALRQETSELAVEDLINEGRRLARLLTPVFPETSVAFIATCLDSRARSDGGLDSVKRESILMIVDKILFPAGLTWEETLVTAVLLINSSNLVPSGQDDIERDKHAFLALLRSTMPKSCRAAESLGALDSTHLDKVFKEFLTNVLPDSQLLQLFDALVNEGRKILFRAALALFSCRKAQLKSGNYKSAQQFWDESSTIDSSIFFQHVFDPRRTFIRRLSRPLSRSFIDSQRTAWAPKTTLSLPSSEHICGEVFLISSDSTLLTAESKSALLERLAQKKSIYKSLNSVAYKLSRDGAGLSNMRSRLEFSRGPMLFVVKLEEEMLVGAFLTSIESFARGGIVGDGHSFIFRIDGGVVSLYPWRGKSDPAGLQFCSLDEQKIVFGDTGALLIDSGFLTCSSAPGSTYTNDVSLVDCVHKVLDIEIICPS